MEVIADGVKGRHGSGGENDGKNKETRVDGIKIRVIVFMLLWDAAFRVR